MKIEREPRYIGSDDRIYRRKISRGYERLDERYNEWHSVKERDVPRKLFPIKKFEDSIEMSRSELSRLIIKIQEK